MVEVEADHSLVNLFHTLSLSKSRSGLPNCDVIIPDTVSYQHGSLRWWYYYETARKGGDDKDSGYSAATDLKGQVMRREKRDCTPSHIEKVFTRGVPEGHPVATFIYKSTQFLEDVTESAPTVVEFLDNAGLREFLHQRDTKPDGILQQFVRTDMFNNVTQVVWTPYLTRATRRQNIHKLTDYRVGLYDRCVTFEGRSHLSNEVICGARVVEDIDAACRAISTHFHSTDHRLITRMVLFFKFNQHRQPVLLYPSAIVTASFRHRHVSGKPETSLIRPARDPKDMRSAILLAHEADRRVMVNLNPVYCNATRNPPSKQRADKVFAAPGGEFYSPDDYFHSPTKPRPDPLVPAVNSESIASIRHRMRKRIPFTPKSLADRVRMASQERPDPLEGTMYRYTMGGGGGAYLIPRTKGGRASPSPTHSRPMSAPTQSHEETSSPDEVDDVVVSLQDGVPRYSLSPSPAPRLVHHDDASVPHSAPRPRPLSRTPYASRCSISLRFTLPAFHSRSPSPPFLRPAEGAPPARSSPSPPPVVPDAPHTSALTPCKRLEEHLSPELREREVLCSRVHAEVTGYLEEAAYRCYSRTRGVRRGVHVVRIPPAIQQHIGDWLRETLTALQFRPSDSSTPPLPCDGDEEDGEEWVREAGCTHDITCAFRRLQHRVELSQLYHREQLLHTVHSALLVAVEHLRSLHPSIREGREPDESVPPELAHLSGTFNLATLRSLTALVSSRLSECEALRSHLAQQLEPGELQWPPRLLLSPG